MTNNKIRCATDTLYTHSSSDGTESGVPNDDDADVFKYVREKLMGCNDADRAGLCRSDANVS